MQPLDPLTLPLTGRRLIEASAGTGKTFTIALLYLRLLLEQGLDVPEILVVTFTNSATEELRARIRARLREALLLLETGDPQGGDPLLAVIVERVEDKTRARTLLTDGLARMDEAAIFTIHGFCRRMLQENAFETAGLFELEFFENENELRGSIIEDFWRDTFYDEGFEMAQWAAKEWGDPAGLGAKLTGTLSRPDVHCIPEIKEREIKGLFSETTGLFQQVQRQWPLARDTVTEILNTDNCLSRNKKDGYGKERLSPALAGMEHLLESVEMPWLMPDCMELLASSTMRKRKKKNCDIPEHSFFELFDSFYTCHTRFINLKRIHILQSARNFLFAELERRKQEQNALFFDDLLSRLYKALQGAGGAKLAGRIRKRFPVAMVDEFQDTDPLQYAIFNHIYRQGTMGLFMIGDPKQAIYSFRGADIFTYIRARRKTDSRFTLDTNYRSTDAMVKAVNRLFCRQASFIFEDDIRYEAVKTGSLADAKALLIDGEKPAPLAAWLLPLNIKSARSKNIAKERATEASTRLCAAEVTRLLDKGGQGKAFIGDRPLVARDLSILVRTHREADQMQAELRRLGVASVYYSRDSVFATDEALQFERLLVALVDPADEGRVRTALTTDFFGLNGLELDELLQNENSWERFIIEFREYHELWRDRGVAVMLQHLLQRRCVTQRLTALPTGERRLTNYLHLGELLQEEGDKVEGMEGLLRWFSTRCHDPKEALESEQLRLESDENLVKIVTIHKSKGLEYEIVFLPFIWNCREVFAREPFSFHDQKTLALKVSMSADPDHADHLQLAKRERLAEDLRLFYVAITRARHRCYFCWGQISGAEKSALAYLLHPSAGEEISCLSGLGDEQIRYDLQSLNDHGHLVEILPSADEHGDILRNEQGVETMQASARQFQGVIRDDWRITSYSRLAAGVDSRPERPVYDPVSEEKSDLIAGGDVFSFPRGSHAGTFLHGLLEELDFPVAGGEDLQALVDIHLERAGISRKWSGVVCTWIPQILDACLDNKDLRLRVIPRAERLVEPAFYYPLNGCRTDKLNRLLAEFGFSTLHEAGDTPIAGLMKGFIDLVFRYQDRFYIADYKSNYLGSGYLAYRQEMLATAMGKHRYDLQYLIYTLALHRYLGTRLGNYSYSHHFGGVYYLFLRGMHPDREKGQGIYFARPEFELVDRLDKILADR